MDPVTVLGAVAATSQLVTQTSNLSSLAADTYHSFRNAPRDLDQLRKKVELLKSKVLQIEKFGDGLHGTDMEALFPQDHRFWYSNALAESVKSLNKLRSLRDSSRSGTARGKLAWAALDKRKADRIMVDLAETGEALDQALQIFSVRLGTLNHTSLGAFKVGQDAIHANGVQLQSSIHELQRVQTLTLSKMEEGNRSYTDLLRTEQAERAEDRKAIQAMREEMLQMIGIWKASQFSSESALPLPPCRDETPPTYQQSIKKMHEVERAASHSRISHHSVASPKKKTSLQWSWDQAASRFEWGMGEYPIMFTPLPLDRKGGESDERPMGLVATKIQFKRKARGRRMDVMIRTSLRVVGKAILQAEVRVRYVASAWVNMPWINTSISIINIRSADDPIFEAIREQDLEEVKRLIDYGEASINDVSDEGGLTLLAVGKAKVQMETPTANHRVQSAVRTNPSVNEEDQEWKQQRQAGVEALLAYLINQGCDLNIQCQSVHNSPSLMASALYLGDTTIAEFLVSRGADPEWSPTYEYLSWAGEDITSAQLRLFHRWGILDWSTPDKRAERQNILHAYCKIGDPELIIPQLEEQGLDIRRCGMLAPTPLQAALENDNIELAAVLLHYGADVELCRREDNELPEDSPLHYVLRKTTGISHAHFLLSCGASPGETWDESFGCAFSNERVKAGIFSFDEVVGVAAHMLYHGGNCHYLTSDRVSEGSFAHLPPGYKHLRMESLYTRTVLNEVGEGNAIWTDQGVVCLGHSDFRKNFTGGRCGRQEKNDIKARRGATATDLTDCDSDSGSDYDHGIQQQELDAFIASKTWQKRAHRHQPKHQRDDTNRAPVACSGRTGFREVVATRKGRRRLAKYPLATSYFAAIRLAGFRAEMDDEGDVWWSDDDGDRYLDARSDPVPEAADGVLDNCPMCRDPENWGLGEMAERRKAGLSAVQKYREQKNEKNRKKVSSRS
ncbi:hypothetical protein S7711_10698 [Stachybotrys chartarum IBT 7711]|uniref:Uncharacterized protein n=1 Tax=Stachybotrys chartarum (strain CBS 109288 / IBT 7711) TaxID=1280523 RepID=A0A084AUT4_STACB|nr:hypothetical protein S7711_10698 [Stachybotrys chartarum IBT 7711]